jgi:SAM-dependent methyltransferase
VSGEIHERFDRLADGYAAYRPTCPPELVQIVAAQCQRHQRAWEPGCGSGQVTACLAEAFDEVLATDPSRNAIEKAPRLKGVRFEQGDASRCDVPDGSVDLIASGQAAHWFDMETFGREVRRVAAADAVVALWCYDRPRVSAEVDAVVDNLYFEVLDECWAPGRQHIDSRYVDLAFPFTERALDIPDYRAHWTVDDMLGYLRTWSAVDSFKERAGGDAVLLIERPLRAAFGSDRRPVVWPTAIRVGTVA